MQHTSDTLLYESNIICLPAGQPTAAHRLRLRSDEYTVYQSLIAPVSAARESLFRAFLLNVQLQHCHKTLLRSFVCNCSAKDGCRSGLQPESPVTYGMLEQGDDLRTPA
uniref:Post-SET domain-containing protein n=1 Tax=Macrostomum lignano TaxID=282301 RepID=A0A1I8FKX0_9PLAT